jgi:hypothetical protein
MEPERNSGLAAINLRGSQNETVTERYQNRKGAKGGCADYESSDSFSMVIHFHANTP